MTVYSFAEIEAQTAALPLAFQLWFQWMFLVIVVAPLLFVRHRQGRIALVYSALFVAIQLPTMLYTGLSNLLSLGHLLVWTPLVVYLARELRSGRIRWPGPIAVWAHVAACTALASLVFDLRDFGRWLAGERGVVVIDSAPPTPWPWLMLILLAIGMFLRYARPVTRRWRDRDPQGAG